MLRATKPVLVAIVALAISSGLCVGQEAMCRERLSVLLRTVETELSDRPNGPLDQVRKAISAPLPIENCSPDLFSESVRRSPFFKSLADQPTYLLASFENKGMEIGVTFRKRDQTISRAYVRFDK